MVVMTPTPKATQDDWGSWWANSEPSMTVMAMMTAPPSGAMGESFFEKNCMMGESLGNQKGNNRDNAVNKVMAMMAMMSVCVVFMT